MPWVHQVTPETYKDSHIGIVTDHVLSMSFTFRFLDYVSTIFLEGWMTFG